MISYSDIFWNVHDCSVYHGSLVFEFWLELYWIHRKICLERAFLSNWPGCPGTHSFEKGGLALTEIHLLVLKASSTVPNSIDSFERNVMCLILTAVVFEHDRKTFAFLSSCAFFHYPSASKTFSLWWFLILWFVLSLSTWWGSYYKCIVPFFSFSICLSLVYKKVTDSHVIVIIWLNYL